MKKLYLKDVARLLLDFKAVESNRAGKITWKFEFLHVCHHNYDRQFVHIILSIIHTVS